MRGKAATDGHLRLSHTLGEIVKFPQSRSSCLMAMYQATLQWWEKNLRLIRQAFRGLF